MPINLNLIVHGRAGSTLVAEMLMHTRQFELWGNRKWACELREFKQPESWNAKNINNSLQRFANKRVLAKMPEFAYFIELLLPHNPRVVVMERSVMERVRSLSQIGWLQKVVDRYEEKGLVKNAIAAFLKITGGFIRFRDFNTQEKAVLVLAYGNWRTRLKLKEHDPLRVLHLYFDDLMLRKQDAYIQLDNFFQFVPGEYWPTWETVRSKKLQKNGRDTYTQKAFTDPYDMDWASTRKITEIIQVFESR